jgi:hypothetical protein
MVQELPNRYVRICVGVRRKPCVKGVVQANSPSSASLRMVMAVKFFVMLPAATTELRGMGSVP